MEKQSRHFICIIYPVKQYLVYEAHTKQLALPPAKFGPKNYSAKG